MKIIILFYALLIFNFAIAENFCDQFGKDPEEFELTLEKQSDDFSGTTNNNTLKTDLFSNGVVKSVTNQDLDNPFYITKFNIGSAFKLGDQKYTVISCRFNNSLKVNKHGVGVEYYKLLSVTKVYINPFKVTSHPINIFKEFNSLCYELVNSGTYTVTLKNEEGNEVEGIVSIYSVSNISHYFIGKRIKVFYDQAYLQFNKERVSNIIMCEDSYIKENYEQSVIKIDSHKTYKILKIKKE